MTGQSVFSSAFIARIFINLVDKGIAVLFAYLIYVKVKNQGNQENPSNQGSNS